MRFNEVIPRFIESCWLHYEGIFLMELGEVFLQPVKTVLKAVFSHYFSIYTQSGAYNILSV